jgi:trk system potassium uptake protein
VTGLVVVDTGSYWSPFGQVVVMLLFQLGGFGLMTAAALLGLMVNRSLRLRTRLLTQAETHSVGLGDVPAWRAWCWWSRGLRIGAAGRWC